MITNLQIIMCDIHKAMSCALQIRKEDMIQNNKKTKNPVSDIVKSKALIFQ